VPADDYEELVRALMGQLASVQDVTTGRLDRPSDSKV